MDRKYIYQVEKREWIENTLGTEAMIPVHGNHKDSTWDIYIQSYLAPLDSVEEELKTDTYDARFGMPGITIYGSMESDEKKYSTWNNDCGQEPLVIERDYNRLAPSNIEIVEEFRLLFNLYFNSQKNEYIDVENDEITFSDVSFVKFVRYFPTNTPIELQKVQLPDGQWAYYYHDPNYRIPPKVDDNLSPIKKFNVECEREICLRFIPHGNPRKVLDITVVLVPDKNLAGQTGWNVWRLDYSSKKEFIQKYNESHSSDPHFHPNCLREEDYD